MEKQVSAKEILEFIESRDRDRKGPGKLTGMKIIRARSGPFVEQHYYEDAAFEDMAMAELSSVGLLPRHRNRCAWTASLRSGLALSMSIRISHLESWGTPNSDHRKLR